MTTLSDATLLLTNPSPNPPLTLYINKITVISKPLSKNVAYVCRKNSEQNHLLLLETVHFIDYAAFIFPLG